MLRFRKCFAYERLHKIIYLNSNIQAETSSRKFIPQAPLDPAMKVKIKQWNAIATWKWNIDSNEQCTICQQSFEAPCSKCKIPGDDCPPSIAIINLRTRLPSLHSDALCPHQRFRAGSHMPRPASSGCKVSSGKRVQRVSSHPLPLLTLTLLIFSFDFWTPPAH